MTALHAAFRAEIEDILGAEAEAFFAALDAPSARALRLNPARSGAEEAAAEFVDGSVPWEARGRYLRPGARPGASIAHAAGAFYLQEASAMLSVNALDPQPGERVLDLCAAPGGKSTQIAAAMAGRGLLVANEPEPARARVLAANLDRMGARNAVAVCAYPDALAARWPGYFDALLCDAPCSGEGMFRREVESRAQWSPGAPEGCARRQAQILDCAAELLRPGGRLVYSTCTFNRKENEETIRAFLQRHPEFAPENFEVPEIGASQGGMLRIWPQRARGDGHFAARLIKRGDSAPAPRSRAKAKRGGRASASGDAAALVARLEAEIGAIPDELKRRYFAIGDALYALPEACPELDGLRLMRPGVKLLRAGRSHVEPSAALAMAMNPDAARQTVELSDTDAQRYLNREPLPCPENLRGWALVLWHNLPLGWAKAVPPYLKAGSAR